MKHCSTVRMVSFMLQSTNSGVSLFTLEHRKKLNLKKRTTLSPQDRDRKAASEIYKFLKEVSLATARPKKKSALRLQITRKTPRIKQAEERINSEILALSKEIELLALEREQKSKQTSLQSKKVYDITSPRIDEHKSKTLIDIAKAIELITSQGAKDALSQLRALGPESKFKSSELRNKHSKLQFSSENLQNSNLTERQKRLELELNKIRKEIDMLSPKRDKELSTPDLVSHAIRPAKIVSSSSHVYRDPVTVTITSETPKTSPISTEHEAQLDFENIMNHREIDLSFMKSGNKNEPGTHVGKTIKDKEGTENSLIEVHTTNIYQDTNNLLKDFKLSDSKMQKLQVPNTQIDFNVREKQPDSFLEQFNKLVNLTLLQRLKETKQELSDTKIVLPTTITEFDSHRSTNKKSSRSKASGNSNKMQEKHKQPDKRKRSTKKRQIIKESEMDEFRRKLRMEYDSHE